MGSFIFHSPEEMFMQDPSLKTVFTKVSFLGYIEQFFSGYTGS